MGLITYRLFFSIYILGYFLFFISLFLPSVSGPPSTIIFGTKLDYRCYLGYEALFFSFVLPYLIPSLTGGIINLKALFVMTIPVCNLLVIISPLMFGKKINKRLLKFLFYIICYASIAVWGIAFLIKTFSYKCLGYYSWCISVNMISFYMIINRNRLFN